MGMNPHEHRKAKRLCDERAEEVAKGFIDAASEEPWYDLILQVAEEIGHEALDLFNDEKHEDRDMAKLMTVEDMFGKAFWLAVIRQATKRV
jgi:hypothetical protein